MKTGWVMAVVLAVIFGAGSSLADLTTESAPTDSAWEAFCDRLKEVGREVERADLPDSPLDRAEGRRYVLQRLAASIDEVLDSETAPPLVTLYSHKLRKFGMDSADAKYSTARIDGQGAWLRLDPRATELLFREYFYDWANERPSQFMIERLDDPGPPAVPGPVATKTTLDAIASVFAATVPKWFEPALDDRRSRVNRLRPPSKSASEGIRENAYGSGWFELEPGEALLIEMDEPDAHLGSFELGNFWWQSIDYVDHTSSLNGFQAFRSSDGRYRLVLSLEDPGVPNWLDPAGHREGVIIYRYQNAADENPVPTARLVKLAGLRDELPADTPVVSGIERAAQIEMRQRHAAHRWAP